MLVSDFPVNFVNFDSTKIYDDTKINGIVVKNGIVPSSNGKDTSFSARRFRFESGGSSRNEQKRRFILRILENTQRYFAYSWKLIC